MNIYQHFRDEILSIVDELASQNVIPAGMDTGRITVEPPREAGHGDMATNAAMVLSKAAGMKPRDLAAVLSERLNTIQWVHETEIAGPGFINLRLESPYWHQRLEEILQNGTAFGDSTLGRGETVNVEYVSANPTGPLHVAHARGAVVGDVLASLLEKAGYAVTREYYVNDAGAQVDILARSAYLRYREALGEDIGVIPQGLYPGDYLKPVGEALAQKMGDKWLDAGEDIWLGEIRTLATSMMLDAIREDLQALGIHFDVFRSNLYLGVVFRSRQYLYLGE